MHHPLNETPVGRLLPAAPMRSLAVFLPFILAAACAAPATSASTPAAVPELPTPSDSAGALPDPDPAGVPRSAAEQPGQEPVGMGVPLVAWNSELGQYELQLVDPRSGYTFKDRPPIPLSSRADYALNTALSPDGDLLAVISGVGKACESYLEGVSCWPSADSLRLIDLRTWREVETDLAAQFPPAYPPFKGWATNLVFRQDARQLALTYHERSLTTLALFDAQTGVLIATRLLDLRPRLVDFSADGSALAIYGSPVAESPGMTQPGPPSALLLDGGTLEVQWKTLLPSVLDGTWCRESCAELNEDTRMVYWSPAVMFDPQRNRLHILHADEDRLTTVDLQARRARTLEIGAVQTWIERLLALTAGVAEAKYWPEGGYRSGVLSLDGGRIFSVGRTVDLVADASGEWSANETSLGLTVIEADTGGELATRESSASRIRSSLDHSYLILDWGLTGSIEVLDAETLEVVGEVEGWEVLPGRRIDGQEVFLLASQTGERLDSPTRMAILTPEPFEFLTPWSVSGLAFWVPSP